MTGRLRGRILALGMALAAPAMVGAQQIVQLDPEDRPIELEVEELFELGGSMQTGWSAFGEIRDVAFDAEGRVYLLDGVAEQVFVIGRNGNLVRTMGGPGDGPGEFGSARGLAVSPGGAVAIWDSRRNTFARFDPAGEYLENVAPDLPGGEPRAPMRLIDDASMVTGTLLMILNGEHALMLSGSLDRSPSGLPIQRIDLGGGDGSVTYEAWLQPRTAGEPGDRPMNKGFESKVWWDASADGTVVVADTVTYRVRVVDGSGTVAREIRRNIVPAPVTDGDREEELERVIDELSQPGAVIGAGAVGGAPTRSDRAERARRMTEDMDFAEEFQVVQGVRVGPDGTIWVQRNANGGEEAGLVDWVTMEGDYLGTVDPEALEFPTAIGPGGLVAVVTEDDFEAPILRVLRVTRR